ncbi:MAG: metallophosphoesterase [Litorilinea sp.]|uniref:Metallophosphoesterase n=1 Tax=Litorilinea aerophila TaxID=1204385 RepID=A0A540VI93_9CHLR|nr:MAG: metallophosphoesterase [Litorilinea sp.]
MRVLAISDKVEPILYSPGICTRVGEVDLILSCGDLPFYYIEYIVSMLNRPCYYVFGNHGREIEYQGGDWQQKTAPLGAENLHRRVARADGLLLAGLEGSIRYNNAPRYQYTESEMLANIGRLAPRLLYNRLQHGRYLDVLVAHSPPFGIHDQPDRAHQGFKVFLHFMRWFRPRYLLHGHIHLYRQNVVTQTRYLDTEVINVYPFRILDLEPGTG